MSLAYEYEIAVIGIGPAEYRQGYIPAEGNIR